jgi:dTMP kinase
VLLFDLEAATGVERIRRRGDQPNLFEDTSALDRARSIFLALAADNPEITRVIDATPGLREVIKSGIEAFVLELEARIAACDESDITIELLKRIHDR